MKRLGKLSAFLAIFLMLPAVTFAQQGQAPATPGGGAQHQHHHMGATDSGKQTGDMKAKHEKWMADMKAMDERLDQKVTAMNNAKGDQKVAAMADVINELVAQRKEMREKMAEMHHGNMCGMMGGEGGMQGMGHGGMMGMDHGSGMSGCCGGMNQHDQSGGQSGNETTTKPEKM